MKTPAKSASWVYDEGVRVHGMWEPLHFERMRGCVGENHKAIYDFHRTRAFMEHLAAEGVNQVWFNWWKGYGLQHERACQDQVARLFPICRELGMRAVCYHTFGSLTFDTLLLEEPDAVNWITRTQTGQPTNCQVTYQCFRYRPCFSSEGYLSYLEKVLTRATDAGADGIHFDNIGQQMEPEACHCERCTRLFREYLKEHFGGDLGEEIFGMRDFSQATIPWFNEHNPAGRFWRASAPHHFAWIDFKAHTLGSAARRLTDFVHRRNPNTFVEFNAYHGDGFPAVFWRGIDYDQMLPKAEVIYDERSGAKRLNAKGAIVGPYRGKKWCRSFGCAHIGHTPELDFCEDVAHSRSPIGFWKKYKQYQLRAQSRARVAVLHERYSLAYNRFEPFEELLSIEQYLIERRIPFDIVHNAQLADIGGQYDLLIVAGAEVIADSVRDDILRFVKGGGNLLLTGAAGVYNRYYRIRQKRAAQITTVQELEEADRPHNAFSELIGPDPLGGAESVIRRQVGQSRAAWIREMDVDRLPRSGEVRNFTEDWLMLPRNATDIDAVFAWLLPDGVGVKVETSGRLYVHFAQRKDTGELLVHMISHEYPRKTARADVRLRVNGKPKSVVSVSTDDEAEGYAERPESFRMVGDELHVAIEEIKNHRTVIVRP